MGLSREPGAVSAALADATRYILVGKILPKPAATEVEKLAC